MTTMTGKLRTTGKKVLVRVLKEAEKTEGGLFRPDKARKELHYGPIAAVGDEISPEDILQEGRMVIWPDYASHAFEWDGVKYAAVHRDDVQGVLLEN